MAGVATESQRKHVEVMVKRQKRILFYITKIRLSIFIHPRGIDLSFERNLGRGREVCLIKESWSKCGLVDHYLSSGSARWFEEVLIA